jgi:hypothetical protein
VGWVDSVQPSLQCFNLEKEKNESENQWAVTFGPSAERRSWTRKRRRGGITEETRTPNLRLNGGWACEAREVSQDPGPRLQCTADCPGNATPQPTTDNNNNSSSSSNSRNGEGESDSEQERTSGSDQSGNPINSSLLAPELMDGKVEGKNDKSINQSMLSKWAVMQGRRREEGAILGGLGSVMQRTGGDPWFLGGCLPTLATLALFCGNGSRQLGKA